jgi:hypothetical protein
VDDVEDADYVVLGQWEEHYFDDVWYSARDSKKPIVTPAFVIDSYKNGSLMNPNDYPTSEPMKRRKGGPKVSKRRPAMGGRKRRGRGRGAAEEAPKWLQFFKETERVRSFQHIGALFKKNPELTHDVLAARLHIKVCRPEL